VLKPDGSPVLELSYDNKPVYLYKQINLWGTEDIREFYDLETTSQYENGTYHIEKVLTDEEIYKQVGDIKKELNPKKKC